MAYLETNYVSRLTTRFSKEQPTLITDMLSAKLSPYITHAEELIDMLNVRLSREFTYAEKLTNMRKSVKILRNKMH